MKDLKEAVEALKEEVGALKESPFVQVTRAKRWGHWFVQDDGAGTCKDAPLLKRQVNNPLIDP